MNQHIPLSNIINKLQRKELLLKLEYDYEKETFRQQTEAMGIGRKVKRGMCWYPISAGRSYYNSLNQLVVEVERQEDKDIEHVFEFGRPVCFFTQNASGQLHYFNFTATVNYVDEDRMVIVLPSADALLSIQATERQLGVQLYFDETSYRLMFEALGQVLKAKGNRPPVALKVLISKELLEENDRLLDTVKLDKDDYHLLKYYNMMVINRPASLFLEP